MSRIWKEPLDPARHRDFMRGHQDAGGITVKPPLDNLLEKWVYFVSAASFTFQFHSLREIEEARDYFRLNVHPANRLAGISLEHYWQRWFERLPPGLNGGTKRQTVLKALERALREFGDG